MTTQDRALKRHLLSAPKLIAHCGITAGLALLSVGCGGGSAQVSGTVVDASGAPLEGIRVVARQETEATWASGSSDANGAFRLSMPDQSFDLPPGDYGVVLTESDGEWDRSGPKKLSPKYSNAATSGVSFSAEAGQKVVLDIVVKK